MNILSDTVKLAMFDDLQERAEALTIENDELRIEIENCGKRFSVLAWSLECATRIAKDLPPPRNDGEAKAPQKRKCK
jgi:hypothetical protein